MQSESGGRRQQWIVHNGALISALNGLVLDADVPTKNMIKLSVKDGSAGQGWLIREDGLVVGKVKIFHLKLFCFVERRRSRAKRFILHETI